MRNISMQLTDNQPNNVPGINRNSSSRGSIRISPPIPPTNESKPILRSNTSNVMRNDLEMQSFIQSQNQTTATNCNDSGNQMFSHQYYDTNNYLSHVNKCQQMAKNGITISHGVVIASGHSTLTPITSVVNNGITSAKSISHSRASLEDHGVDVGRLSPSSSSNDSRKSRYSSASLDSGRGSDTKISGQSHRVSVHSCESLGSSSSNKDNYNRNSSSSSSIGSGNSVGLECDITITNASSVTDHNWTPVSGGHSFTALSIPEMVLHGIADEEIIYSWLSKINFEEYANNFIRAGYDMPTISRMTPEDLTAIGITKPGKRQILKTEIQKLNIADGIPNYKPNTLLEWLKLLRLEQYYNTLSAQGYDSIDRVTELAWEDLEEVGINKLGHQKKIMLAIKKIKSLNNNMSRSNSSETSHNLSLPLVYNSTTSCPDIPTRPNPSNYQLPLITHQFQDTVPIKMFAPTKSTPSPTAEKPITPQLKTFQQLPTNGYMFCRQKSEGQYYGHNGYMLTEPQNCVFQSSRGRSLESLDNSENNYYQMYCGKQQQRLTINGFQRPVPYGDNESNYMRDSDQIHGYETDSEVINSYANNRKVFYEIDGTATLQRPKGMIKTKPIAKIVAKTRQTDSNDINQQMYSNEPQKISSFDKRLDSVNQSDKNSINTYICDDNQTNPYFQDMSSQMYLSLQRKKPPPPPKRVNSIRNTGSSFGQQSMTTFSPTHTPVHREGYEDFQEEVFASCVKSLTSRFSINNNSDEILNRQSNERVDYSNDFPPPPSPLSFVECQNYNTLQRRKDISERECNISSSSSTESMPFANDNIGTILRVNSESIGKELGSPSSSFTSSAPSSMTNSPSSAVPKTIITQDISNKILDSEFLKKSLSPTKRNDRMPTIGVQSSNVRSCVPSAPIDQLDDIETMLVNLSEQLDLMLENENHNKNRNN